MPFDAAPHAQTLRTRNDCLVCPVQNCLARDASVSAAWNSVLQPCISVMPGAGALFETGDPVDAVYSVRAGCIKTFTVDADGREHVRGFFLPGDLVALDALGSRGMPATAVAVTPTQMCVAPVVALRKVMRENGTVAQMMLDQASRDLALALAINGDFTADERVAAFLLHLAKRLDSRDGIVRLPMTRRDIGSYLRLATETVCRVLTRFEQKGWLASQDKRIQIIDRAALQAVAAPVGLPSD